VVTETQRTELTLCTVVLLDALITDLQAAGLQSQSCGREMGGERAEEPEPWARLLAGCASWRRANAGPAGLVNKEASAVGPVETLSRARPPSCNCPSVNPFTRPSTLRPRPLRWTASSSLSPVVPSVESPQVAAPFNPLARLERPDDLRAKRPPSRGARLLPAPLPPLERASPLRPSPLSLQLVVTLDDVGLAKQHGPDNTHAPNPPPSR